MVHLVGERKICLQVCPLISVLKASYSAQSEFSSLLGLSCPESRSSIDNSSLQWITPPVNLVNFNCDGAFKRDAAAIGLLTEILMESL